MISSLHLFWPADSAFNTQPVLSGHDLCGTIPHFLTINPGKINPGKLKFAGAFTCILMSLSPLRSSAMPLYNPPFPTLQQKLTSHEPSYTYM